VSFKFLEYSGKIKIAKEQQSVKFQSVDMH